MSVQEENIPESIFAERLQALLDKTGENQVTLSKKTGIKQANLSRYLSQSKRRTPKADILRKLASFFKVSTDYFLIDNIPEGMSRKHEETSDQGSSNTTRVSYLTTSEAEGKPQEKDIILHRPKTREEELAAIAEELQGVVARLKRLTGGKM